MDFVRLISNFIKSRVILMKKINFLFLIIVFLIPGYSFSWFENDFEPVWQDSGSGFVSSEEKFTNFLGMEFVYIKPGTFMMGSPSSESGRDSDEKQHKVTLTKGYFLQTTEVTQGQWKKVMGNNPSYFKNCGDNCPVESVSWNDAKEFIKKLNNKDKNFTYRLPTEAEWEYAARGGTKTALYTGDITIKGQNNAPELDKIAWYGGNSCVDYSGGYDCSGWIDKQYSCSRCGTHRTGLKTPNAFGLYDMIGNVWEWCEDWKGDYPSGHVTDPSGPGSGSNRVLRGGSWIGYAGGCRSAFRGISSPGDTNSYGGFRLAAFRGRH
jgi:formylglycine-generating enzyme required for sulfatase activity